MAAAAASRRVWGAALIPMPATRGAVDEKLDAFIVDYMRVMNAPGMIQALTDSNATLRTASSGFANLDLKSPVTTEQLFQIGSITKSFVALILLQLRDEGKLDLHRPVLDYLPWLPVNTPYGPITVHHLLTHSSGLPDATSIFQSDPTARHVQGFAPGAHFHYCNLGFAILGQIIEKLDGKVWRQSLQARILSPLGMKEAAPVITIESSARSAIGYQSYFDDQVYPRQGRLAPRPPEVFDNPAGSIASTPGDMAIYLRMLLNEGQGVVSADGFRLMSTPYIKAPEFSPTAFYGYGIAVDLLDGHRILRHTGGMSCFASSIHVDLDGGVAAFASINAMQGYRPTQVTQYAVQLLRAQNESKALPAAPEVTDLREVENAHEFMGVFRSSDGRELVFKADGARLLLVTDGREVDLQRKAGDSFVSTEQGVFSDFSLIFGRGMAPAPSSLVVEVGYGPEWYVNTGYLGPHEFAVPAAYSAFTGHYRSDGGEDVRVFLRKGRLWVGDSPLTEIGSSLFRVGEEDWMPDTVEFLCVVEGRARLMRVIDDVCWRIEVG
jgi:D-alanyl-D-alanine carboxypeptidase